MKKIYKYSQIYKACCRAQMAALLVLCGMMLSSPFLPAHAQNKDIMQEEQNASAITAPTEEAEAPVEKKAFKKQPIDFSTIGSVLFTKWEYAALNDAIRTIGKAAVRAPTKRELRRSDGPEPERFEQKLRPPPEERDISLNGLVYGGKKDWTIWLNGKRVTPDALPKEVLDLQVYKEYIEMKWYDDYSQSVYPIRLRPHQRFNLDTRIFLPG